MKPWREPLVVCTIKPSLLPTTRGRKEASEKRKLVNILDGVVKARLSINENTQDGATTFSR